MSRICSILTKIGMEYTMGTQIVRQKEFLLLLSEEKSWVFVRKFAIISNK